MRYLLAVIAVLTGLVVTGCASDQSKTVESKVKLIEYEKCLILQQDALNIINNQIAKDETYFELMDILMRQSGSEGKPRFDIHLENCERYRP